MRYPFDIVDVFTNVRFGGNPLAVVHDADALTDAQMQAIAREFNFSETTFVLTPENPAHDARVRIFTPGREVPFAGHPNVGTAFVLASRGAAPTGAQILRFEERAGLVPVVVHRDGAHIKTCELTAPEPLSLGEPIAATAELARLAGALGLAPEQISTQAHAPCIASVGLPFLCVELRDLAALAAARLLTEPWFAFSEQHGVRAVHLHVRASVEADVDVQARMFTAHHGVREDPATGSANCALAGLLATLEPVSDGTFDTAIAQGLEMGRPSRLQASVDKRGGRVVAVRIGGTSVAVARGELVLD